MLRCSNCHLCVDRMQRHIVSSLPSTILTLLSTWRSLKLCSPAAVICQECFIILNEYCKNGHMNAERELGHTHVCLGCGRSVLEARQRIRHHTVETNDPLIAVILSWDAYNEVISRYTYVCHQCWMRATRQLSQIDYRGQQFDEHAIEHKPAISELPSTPLPEEMQNSSEPVVQSAKINLPNYRRVANTSRRCIFQGCAKRSWHSIPMLVKVALLKQYKIYIPIHSRVCKTHLHAKKWSLLKENSNLTCSFTAQQIENLIRIVER